MKLITLNVWGGIAYKPLAAFIRKQSSQIDIFCFQEMLFGSAPTFTPTHKARSNIFSEIVSWLPGFTSYRHFAHSGHFWTEPISFKAGQAIFVKSSLRVSGDGGFVCYEGEPSITTTLGGKLTGNCQWVDIADGEDTITVANLHGLWQENSHKMDTPERLVQSRMIKKFLDGKVGKKILCGDFNLLPNGKSMEILEEGMRNLIKEYRIQSTRSSLYKKEVRFANYVLVSPEIKVKDFRVLPDEVSDHLPLYLEFN